MIDGNGFFILGPKNEEIDTTNPDEMTKTTLSRVGNFVFDGDGYLCDGSGNVVYGYENMEELMMKVLLNQ